MSDKKKKVPLLQRLLGKRPESIETAKKQIKKRKKSQQAQLTKIMKDL